jgi:branched-chain amino acid transport system substrate-binding protein
VVFFEGYKKGEKDFSAYIARIKEANADFLFLPNYYADVTEQVKQVRQAGLKIPFLGSDDWSAPNLMATGGQDIEGAYHSGHYAPDQKVPSIAAFVELFKKRHAGEVPDDVAALTYDATMLLRQVLSTATAPDREAIRDAFSRLTTYEGIMVKIEGGKRIFVTSIEP